MNKTKIYYILTLGIGYLIAKNKAKKIANSVNSNLTVSEKVPFEVSEILNAIGGIGNYVSHSATINSIKFEVKDTSLIDRNKIKQMGAKGTMLNEDSVSCLFGDYSKKLADLITQHLAK